MKETPRPFPQRPAGVATLGVAHLLLGAGCLYALLSEGLLVGFWEAVGLGFGMMFVGAVSTGVLTHLNRRLRWLWISSFSIVPFVYTVPSYIRYVETGDTLPMTYWTMFPIGVAAMCFIGSILGAEYEMWNRYRQPMRGRFIRMLIRWLS